MSEGEGIISRIFSNDTGKEIQEVKDKTPIRVEKPTLLPEDAPLTVWGARRKNQRAELYRELIEIATETYDAKEKLQRAKRRSEKMGDILEGVDLEIAAELELQKLRINNEINAAHLLSEELGVERLKKQKELERLGKKEEVLSDRDKQKRELEKLESDFAFDAQKAQIVRKQTKALEQMRDEELRDYIADVKEREGRILAFADMEDWPEADLHMAQGIVNYFEDQKVKHIAKAK